MARIRPVFNNFSNGELSPLFYGRFDTPNYRSGCKELNNMLIDRRGGAYSRPPLMFAGQPKSNNVCRFIPFISSRDGAYVLELTPNVIRIWFDGELVTSGGNPIELTTPYRESDIFDIQFAQANDRMYLVSDSHSPKAIERVNPTSWTFTTPAMVGTAWDVNGAVDDADGYPRTVCFFQQRLVFGGRISEPQTIWMSRTADFENFSDDTGSGANPDDNPLTLVIAAYTQELIQWLAPSRSLFVGTTGNEQRILPNGNLSPANPPDISRQSSYGSRYIQPVFIGTKTIFVQATGKQLRNYDLNLRANVEIYDSLDLTMLANHLGDKGINQIAYQQVPESILWVVTDNGELLTMTYDPSMDATDYQSVGWSTHDIDGIVETVTVIPRPNRDEVWVCVNRNGTRYIANMDEQFDCLDFSYIKESATAFNIMEDLDLLNGEEVTIVADGALIPPQTVTNNQLVFDKSYRFVQIGLPYTQALETMPVIPNGASGTTAGRKKWFNEMFVKLHDSLYPKINGTRPDTRSPSTPMGNREPFFTGDVKVMNTSSGLDATIRIEQDLPFRTYVLAVHGNLEVGSE